MTTKSEDIQLSYTSAGTLISVGNVTSRFSKLKASLAQQYLPFLNYIYFAINQSKVMNVMIF